MKISFLSVILLVFTLHLSAAQTFTNYNTANTSTQLPHYKVNCLSIDSEGNKWFGTDYGLSKFDGNGWHIFNHRFIRNLTSDQAGNCWFFSNDTIIKFDGTNYYYYTDQTYFKDVGAVTSDQNGNIWFGCDSILIKYDGTTWTTINSGFYDVTCISVDLQGKVWMGGDNGVITYDGTSWYSYSFPLILNKHISAISFDHSGWTWVATQNGAIKLKGTQISLVTIPITLYPSSNHISAILIDENDSKYFGTDGGGIKKLTGSSWSTICMDQGLLSNIVTDLDFDSENRLWVCMDGGVTVIADSLFTSYTNNGLKSNLVSAVIRDKNDDIWFATDKGVSKYDGQNWTNYSVANGLADNVVTCMTVDQIGNKWFGTQGNGLSKFDGNSWQTFNMSTGLPGNSILSIKTDYNNGIWFSIANNGVCRMNGNEITIFNQSNCGIANNYITSIGIDTYGRKWFGTNLGVCRYDDQNWMTFIKPGAITDFYDSGLEFDLRGYLWLATASNLFRFSGYSWTDNTSLLEFPFYPQIACDASDNVYISSSGNLYKYDWDTIVNLADKMMFGLHTFPHSLYIDRFGSKWHTFGMNGVFKCDDGGPGPLLENKILLKALVYDDNNGNGTKELDEPGLPMQIVSVDSLFIVTQDQGLCSILCDEGLHTVKCLLPQNWVYTSDSIITLTLNYGDPADTLFFGLQPISQVSDVSVSITGTIARITTPVKYWINYTNKGSLTQSGTIILTVDSLLTILGTYPEPDQITDNTLIWNFNDFAPLQSSQISIYSKLPSLPSLIGDTLNASVAININNDDMDPSDNQDSTFQIIIGSADPNDKLVTPEGKGSQNQVVFGQELTYTIRFQNTGNDTAFYVQIYDTIDKMLNISTLRLIGSSHPCNLEIKGSNILVFKFEDINLPDSNKNEIASNGFVKYAIKPKNNLPENTVVFNSADIYFDFNPAVKTNTTTSSYISPSYSISEKETIWSHACPNPFTDITQITFYNHSDAPFYLKLVNMQGIIIEEINNIHGDNIDIDGMNLKAGGYIYFLTNMKTGDCAIGKLLKYSQ